MTVLEGEERKNSKRNWREQTASENRNICFVRLCSLVRSSGSVTCCHQVYDAQREISEPMFLQAERRW
jgi:hypothetical protein